MTYWTSATGSTLENNLGRLDKAIRYTGGQIDFTGSNMGFNSVIVKTASTVTASLSGGGDISLEELSAGVVYDIII